VRHHAVDVIARTLLYEGYALYPYRPSAVKNQQRFNFGVLYPDDYSRVSQEPSFLQTECPLKGTGQTTLDIGVRFLQLIERHSNAQPSETWLEGVEHEAVIESAAVADVQREASRLAFSFPVGESATGDAPKGSVEASVDEVRAGDYKLTVRVWNQARCEGANPTRHDALRRSLVSAHVVVTAADGDLMSVIDPPEAFRDIAASCSNVGVWPVLIGDDGSHDCVLASPIILYDYPKIAPESPGDLFDGTEIDEILALRILTLTDEEKREARGADDHVRQILDRTEALPPEHWAKLHGAVRGLRRVTTRTS
jgi:hydrogenase maturation protease